MTLVKICGICDLESAEAAIRAGADMIGFHFCPSPRRIEPELARKITSSLSRQLTLVGVFIDDEPGRVAEIAELCGLDLIQLHGSEPAGYPAPRPAIKVLKVRDGRLPDVGSWPDPIMLDTWTVDQRGGSGRSWDWELARPLLADRQVFIGGGLTAANVGGLVGRLRPYGVDVSSGVESEPRRKDPELVRAFVQAVREVDDE